MTLEQAIIGLLVGLSCAGLLAQWLKGEFDDTWRIDDSKTVDFIDLRRRAKK